MHTAGIVGAFQKCCAGLEIDAAATKRPRRP
jgi:hypothetical protein